MTTNTKPSALALNIHKVLKQDNAGPWYVDAALAPLVEALERIRDSKDGQFSSTEHLLEMIWEDARTALAQIGGE